MIISKLFYLEINCLSGNYLKPRTLKHQTSAIKSACYYSLGVTVLLLRTDHISQYLIGATLLTSLHIT